MSDKKFLKIPLIKENRINKLEGCLECIAQYPFDREKQRECILALYPGKSEKSTFRGMVIPSLRHLGLILGYGDLIRLSANGKIIVESKSINDELHQRVLRAVIFEIDKRKFRFMQTLTHITTIEEGIPIEDFIQTISSMIIAPSQKQKNERIRRWLSVLKQTGLITQSDLRKIKVNKANYREAIIDLSLNNIKIKRFREYLFNAYFSLSKDAAGVVDIADLREKVAIKMLRNDSAIFTEGQFDEMLRKLPLITDEYIISLGRPMGADEKLFEYKGKYFRTFSLHILKKNGRIKNES